MGKPPNQTEPMKPTHYSPKILACLAPDGEAQFEGTRENFPDTDAAWEYAGDMGSRWFFYPVCVVCTPGKIIAAVPPGIFPEWIGRKLATLQRAFAADPELVCEYVNESSFYPVIP